MKTSTNHDARDFKSILVAGLALFLTAQTSFAQQSLQVAAWGRNGNGQTWVPQNLSGVKAVAGSYDFALALMDDGTVRAWGGAAAWQTNLPPGLTNISAIAACWTHCLVLRSNGTVKGWGDSEVLSGFFPSNPSQVTNPSVSSVAAIAVGPYYSVLVQSNGSVWPYGTWYSGASLGSAPDVSLSQVTAVAASDAHYLALKRDGTVAVRSAPSPPGLNVPAGLTGVKAISVGNRFCTVLRSNGTVVSWGLSVAADQTNVPPNLSNVVAIASGDFHSLALDTSGNITSWGYNLYGESMAPAGLTNIVSLAASLCYSMAVASNAPVIISKQPKGATVFPGTDYRLGCTATGRQPLAYQWQWNNVDVEGGTKSTLLLTNVSTASAGEYRVVITNEIGSVTSVVASVTTGPIVAWGNNLGEQNEPSPGLTNPLSLFSSAGGLSPWGVVDFNGRISTWCGSWGTVPATLSNVVQGAAGNRHVIALRANGTVEAWGDNSSGQRDVPSDLSNVVSIAAGSSHSLALKSDGTVAAWGSSFVTNAPVDLNNISTIGAAASHSFALTTTGTIRAWGGLVPSSLTNIPPSVTNVAAIAVGGLFGLALKADGTVTNWGSGGSPPSGLSNVVSIAVGRAQALALLSDGTLATWSSFASLTTNPPAGLSNVTSIAFGDLNGAVIVGTGLPAFATKVTKRSVNAGGVLQLPAFAASSVPMSYQWFFNNQPLDGQTNAILQLNGVPVTFAGNYTVVVSNAVGVVTSAVTSVTITRDPVRFITTSDVFNVTNDTVNLRLAGLAGGGPVVLYASTNAANWEPIFTNPPVVGVLDIADPAFTNNTYRFYQAVEGP